MQWNPSSDGDGIGFDPLGCYAPDHCGKYAPATSLKNQAHKGKCKYPESACTNDDGVVSNP